MREAYPYGMWLSTHFLEENLAESKWYNNEITIRNNMSNKITANAIKEIFNAIAYRESALEISLNTIEKNPLVHEEVELLLEQARNAIIMDKYKEGLEKWVLYTQMKASGDNYPLPDYLLLKYSGEVEELVCTEPHFEDLFISENRKRGFLLKV